MPKTLIVFCFLANFFFSSCEKPARGCTDSKALNKDYAADEDDGSCTYSRAVFYQAFATVNFRTIVGVEVNVDGTLLGSTFAIYPAGPGNCSAVGTLVYQFQDGESIDWNSKIYLEDGTILLGSGTARADARNDCIRVNATPF